MSKNKSVARSTLRYYILILLLFLSLAALFGFDCYRVSSELMSTAFNDKILSSADEANSNFLRNEEAIFENLHVIASLIPMHTKIGNEAEMIQAINRKNSSKSGNYLYMDADGECLSLLDGTKLNVSDRTYFIRSMNGEDTTSDVLSSRTNSVPALIRSVPVYTNGEITGVLAYHDTCEAINEEYRRSASDGFDVYLVRTNGTPIAKTGLMSVCDTVFQLFGADAAEKLENALIYGESGILVTEIDGIRRSVAYAPAEIDGWHVITISHSDEILARKDESRSEVIFMLLKMLGLITAALVSFIIVLLLKEKQVKALRKDVLLLMDSSEGGVYKVDAEDFMHPYSFYSDGLARLVGCSAEVFESSYGSNVINMVCPIMRTETLRSIEQQLSAGGTFNVYYRIIRADDSIIWITNSAKTVTDKNGKKTLYGMIQDVTDYKSAVEANYLKESQYQALYEGFDDIHVEIDTETGESTCNDNFLKRFSYENMNFSLVGTMITSGFIHKDDLVTFRLMQQAYDSRKNKIEGDLRLRDVTGKFCWFNVQANLIKNRDDRVLKCIFKFTDIAEFKARQEEEQERAKRDPLTGLYTHEAGKKLITTHINTNFNHTEYAYMLISPDSFDKLEQMFTRTFINALMSEFASVMRRKWSESCILAGNGTELILFVKDASDDDNVISIAEEILRIFSSSIRSLNGVFPISASIGIAKGIEATMPYHAIEEKARKALFSAKKRPGSFEFFSSHMAGNPAFESSYDVPPDYLSRFTPSLERIDQYVYNILDKLDHYECSLELALTLIAYSFGLDRITITEIGIEQRVLENGFVEWLAEGSSPCAAERLKIINSDTIGTILPMLNECGVFPCFDTSTLAQTNSWLNEYYKRSGTTSVVEYPYFGRQGYRCLITYERTSDSLLKVTDVSPLAAVGNIIGRYIERVRNMKRLSTGTAIFKGILDSALLNIYVVDTESYKLLYADKNICGRFSGAEVGSLCYAAISGRDSICENCMIEQLKSEGGVVIKKINDSVTGEGMMLYGSLIKWTGGSRAALVVAKLD